MPKKLNLNVDEIVEKYLNGSGSYDLAKEYNTSEFTIRNRLRGRGVEIRKSNEYTDKLNTYHFDDKWLDELDCQEKYYFLGFFAADGCNYTRGNLFSIGLQEQDKYMLEKFLELLKSDKPLELRPANEDKYGKRKNFYYFKLNSKHFCDRLNELGMVPRKTFLITFPSYCPKDEFRHFLRGLIDGDGTIGLTSTGKEGNCQCHIRVVGTYDLLNGIKEFLKDNLGIDSVLAPVKKVYSLSISKQYQVVTFLEWLYKDSTIHLTRKYEHAKTFLDIKKKMAPKNSAMMDFLKQNKDNIIYDYEVNHLSTKELMKKYNCSESSILRRTHRTCR